MNAKKIASAFLLGLIFLLSRNVFSAPIELWAPWTADQRWQLGGAGSFYGEGYHIGSSHFCVDLNAVDFDDMGQNILAAADGVVAEADFNDGYGWNVRINHANNTQTLYGHMIEQPSVVVGQRVSHGDVIGRCDNTPGMPYSTGSHVHFCLFQNGVSIPPSPIEGHDIFNGIVLTSHNLSQPIYSCEYYRQDPDGLVEMEVNEKRDFVIAFRNTGTNAWSNNRQNENYVQLRSVSRDGSLASSFLCDESWIGHNCERVTSLTAENVRPGQIGWFKFKGKPRQDAELDHEYKVYFMLWHKTGGYVEEWSGTYFRVVVVLLAECQVGQIEDRLCDFCGHQVRRCTNKLKWTDWDQCMLLPGLQCDPDQFEIEQCGHCGSMRRDCDISCHWGFWEECVLLGVCEPGQSEDFECQYNIGECRVGRATRTCGSTCLWASLTDCIPTGATPEICDFKDNDCNGIVDDVDQCKQNVYQYFYGQNGDTAHLLKTNNDPIGGYRAEGFKFRTYRERIDDSLTLLWRLRRENPRDHFYTVSGLEKDLAMQNSHYELKGDVGYCAKQEIAGSVPLYRLYNEGATDHLYTTNRDERDSVADHLGYRKEGIECWVWLR